jgi:hypothetical protein
LFILGAILGSKIIWGEQFFHNSSKMEDVYYLVHSTDIDPSGFKTLMKTPCNDIGQFPGVFMTLVTKHNIDTETYYPGKYMMLFSKDLLKQKNYHINVIDCNGMVTEHYTYYPWNLSDAVNYIKSKEYGSMNEVIFHDDIDIKKYLCATINTKPFYKRFIKKEKDKVILPHKEMRTVAEPDMTKMPFYCFTMEDIFDGDPAPNSSLRWFQLLVRVANIQEVPDSIQGCIDALREKSEYLCNHREEQNIQLLKDYTEHRISGGHQTRKRIRKSQRSRKAASRDL